MFLFPPQESEIVSDIEVIPVDCEATLRSGKDVAPEAAGREGSAEEFGLGW